MMYITEVQEEIVIVFGGMMIGEEREVVIEIVVRDLVTEIDRDLTADMVVMLHLLLRNRGS